MGIFSETIAADPNNKKIRPLTFKADAHFMMDKMLDFLNDNNFQVELVSRDFQEIYAVDDYREYTFTFISDGSATSLRIVLFTRFNKLAKKKYLLQTIDKIKESFKDYL